MNLKIYEIKSGGELEWVAARSIIEALQVLCNVSGMDICELTYSDTIKEIPEAEWQDYKIKDEYGKAMMTFQDWMNINNKPDYIATTAF